MKLVIISRIEGLSEGYAPGLVHEMTNGLHWRQAGRTERRAILECPEARLYHDGSAYFLEVEGLGGVVRVELVACRRKSWPDLPGCDGSANFDVVGQGIPSQPLVE